MPIDLKTRSIDVEVADIVTNVLSGGGVKEQDIRTRCSDKLEVFNIDSLDRMRIVLGIEEKFGFNEDEIEVTDQESIASLIQKIRFKLCT